MGEVQKQIRKGLAMTQSEQYHNNIELTGVAWPNTEVLASLYIFQEKGHKYQYQRRYPRPTPSI